MLNKGFSPGEERISEFEERSIEISQYTEPGGEKNWRKSNEYQRTVGQHKTHQHTKMEKSEGEKKKRREKYFKTNGEKFPKFDEKY